ncbi:hypothetical protein EDB89DRAFT_1903316 [Lactarius sanguifluus]|nr:hypothetical protein EDB89DRAFT_1903316 [Lactarius sanguifluus]
MPPALSLHPVAVAYWRCCCVTAAAVVVVGVVTDHGCGPLSFVIVVVVDLLSMGCRWGFVVVVWLATRCTAIVVVQAHTKVIVAVQLTDDAELPTPGDCQFRKCGPARRCQQQQDSSSNDAFGRRSNDDNDDGATPVDHSKAIPIDNDNEATQQ